MKNPFSKDMAKKSNEQLNAILTTNRNRYQPTALEAAEAELNKRRKKSEGKQAIYSQNAERIDHSSVFGTGKRILNFLLD